VAGAEACGQTRRPLPVPALLPSSASWLPLRFRSGCLETHTARPWAHASGANARGRLACCSRRLYGRPVRTDRWAPQVCGNPRRPRNARQCFDVIKRACREIVGLAQGVLSAADDRGRPCRGVGRRRRRIPPLFQSGPPDLNWGRLARRFLTALPGRPLKPSRSDDSSRDVIGRAGGSSWSKAHVPLGSLGTHSPRMLSLPSGRGNSTRWRSLDRYARHPYFLLTGM
jgi:hypothetical protein